MISRYAKDVWEYICRGIYLWARLTANNDFEIFAEERLMYLERLMLKDSQGRVCYPPFSRIHPIHTTAIRSGYMLGCIAQNMSTKSNAFADAAMNLAWNLPTSRGIGTEKKKKNVPLGEAFSVAIIARLSALNIIFSFEMSRYKHPCAISPYNMLSMRNRATNRINGLTLKRMFVRPRFCFLQTRLMTQLNNLNISYANVVLLPPPIYSVYIVRTTFTVYKYLRYYKWMPWHIRRRRGGEGGQNRPHE